MTLTLKEAITATQTTVDVDGTDSLSNGDLYSIEAEQVYIVGAYAGDVQPGATAWQRLNLQRGQLGTTEVAHAAGTTLTIVGTPLGATGEQTIRLLGPYIAKWDDAPTLLGSWRIRSDPLAAGVLVVNMLAFVIDEWDGTGATYVSLEAQFADALAVPQGNTINATPPEWDVYLTGYPDPATQTNWSLGTLPLLKDSADNAAPIGHFRPVKIGTDGTRLVFQVDSDASALTQGETHVYLLTAEPSA